MKRKPMLPPTGKYVVGEIMIGISEEEKAGRPLPPLIELLPPRSLSSEEYSAIYLNAQHQIPPKFSPGTSDGIIKLISEEEKAGRPLSPLLELMTPQHVSEEQDAQVTQEETKKTPPLAE